MNVAQNLENAAFHFPNRCAVFENQREITFEEFNQVSAQVASALCDVSIQPGDHVALCAPNSFSWLAFYFGILKAGAVAVTFSHLLTKNELIQIITDCRPKILFTIDEKLKQLEELGIDWRSEIGEDGIERIVVTKKTDDDFD